MIDFSEGSERESITQLMIKMLELDAENKENAAQLERLHDEQRDDFYAKMVEMTGLSEEFVRFIDSPAGVEAAQKLTDNINHESFNINQWIPGINSYIEQTRTSYQDSFNSHYDAATGELNIRELYESFGLGGLYDQLEEFNRGFQMPPPEIIVPSPEVLAPTGEGREFSEHDSFIDAGTQALEELVCPELIAMWDHLSLDEKERVLDVITWRISELSGIPMHGILIENLGYGTNGENRGDGWMYMDINHMLNSSFKEVLDTLLHEARHEFQREVVRNPDRFPDVSPETKAAWAGNMPPQGVYISGEDDFYGYLNQPLEVDAREAAETMIDIYNDNNDAKLMSYEDIAIAEGYINKAAASWKK